MFIHETFSDTVQPPELVDPYDAARHDFTDFLAESKQDAAHDWTSANADALAEPARRLIGSPMPPRKHIGILINSLGGGGAERAMVRLANDLADRGFQIDILLIEKAGPYLGSTSSQVRVIDLRGDPGKPLRSLLQVVSYLQKERPASLIATLKESRMVALWAKRLSGSHTRLLTTIRGNMVAEDKRLHRRFARGMIYRWADEIVAVSEGVADDFARFSFLPRSSIKVIYNGVVSAEFKQNLNMPVRHSWLEGSGPPVILAVGRMVWQKDYPTLIRAFARVRAQREARLLILGEGQDRTRLEQLCRDSGIQDDVSMPGFVEHPQAYMARASLVALSSVLEGLPNVLIEAMAAGTPVVATDCPSGPREILDNGRCGTLVRMGDAAGLASAICDQIDNPIAPDVLKERASRFTVEACTNGFLTLAGFDLD